MGFTTSTATPRVTITGTNTTTTISNIAVPVANTEQSIALPASCKGFLIRSRNGGVMKVRYVSAGNHVTVTKNGVYTDNNFYSSQTIYFESSKAGDIIEIVQHA